MILSTASDSCSWLKQVEPDVVLYAVVACPTQGLTCCALRDAFLFITVVKSG